MATHDAFQSCKSGIDAGQRAVERATSIAAQRPMTQFAVHNSVSPKKRNLYDIDKDALGLKFLFI
jgi:hypothetical protein